ncbi:MAG TPA: PKD domain-containing protein, partial [Acidimicrobiia bacterium]|nr:PKD domain-containing protein [Acidimicrobiia bacterium]
AGALFNNDTMMVTGTTISGSQGDDGGAVYNAAGDMVIRSGQFSNNGPLDVGRGGAIYVGGGSVMVAGSTFQSNTNGFGGSFANTGGELTILSSTVRDSAGYIQGGALYNVGGGSTTVVGSDIGDIPNQESPDRGGILYSHGGSLTVVDTVLSNAFASSEGGAIYSGGNGTTSITSVTIDNTTASHGGAIWNDSGTMAISDVTVTSPRAAGSAGAIYNGGDMTISESTISGGVADQGGNIYQGAGSMTIDASTIENGTGDAFFEGGGLYIASGQVDVSRSTLTGNAGFTGAAIHNANGTLDVIGSTISANLSADGGSIVFNGGSASLTIAGTILGDNPGSPNCSLESPISSWGFNLSDDDSCGFSASSDIENSTGLDLGGLADNGGPTETMMPQASSEAIGVEQCFTFFDQRGAARAFDGFCDIGAVDADGQVPVRVPTFYNASGPITEGSAATLVTLASGPAQASLQYQYDCTGGTHYSTPGDGTGRRGTGTCTFADEGTYDVSVLVCDSTFTTCVSDETTVDVLNVAPTVGAPTVTQTGMATVSLVSLTAVTGPETDEGDTVIATAVFHDPGTADTHTCTVDYGDGDGPQPGTVVDSTCVGPEHTYLEDHPGHPITVMVTDNNGASGHGRAGHTVRNRSPILHEFLAPLDPVVVGETVHASLEFSDPGVLDTHSAEWDWGDGTTSAATITEANGTGVATGTHVYSAPGLYTLTVTLVDDDTGFATTSHEHIKVHAPGVGFVTGAGTFQSPAGAYLADPSFIGRAQFNFVGRHDGQAAPDGRFRFRLMGADLRFESSGHDALTLAGPWARIEGTGTVNGQGVYDYLLTIVDGKLLDGEDAIRIRIRERAADGSPGIVIYDSQLVGDTHDAAMPTVELAHGSITIHR